MPAKPDSRAEKAALKTALSEARAKPISFAALITKDGIVFQAEKNKSVDAMKKAARGQGGGTRGAWGKMSSSGSSILLICDEEPASKIEQIVRKHFADRGHSVKVEVRLKTEEYAVEEPEEVTATETPEPEPAPEPEPEPELGPEPELEPELDTSGPTEEEPEEEAEDPDDPDDEDDLAAQTGDLDRLLKAARKKQYFFALMLGKEAPVLKAHRRRKPGKLILAARQEGAGPRGGWGRMNVEGRTVVLTCEEAPPKSLARQARLFLRSQDLKYKVICRLPSGEVVDSDDDEEEILAEAPQVAVPQEPGTLEPAGNREPRISAALAAKLDKARQVVALFADAPQDAARLQGLLDAANQAASSGDEVAAAQQFAELAQLARETPRTPAERRARSIGAFVDMRDDISETVRQFDFAAGYLTELCRSGVAACNTGDFNLADRRAEQVRRGLQAAKAGPLDEDQLESIVAGLMPKAETAPAEFDRITAFLKPVLESDDPQKQEVDQSVDAYRDAAARQDTSGVLAAIGDLRRHEATLNGVGHQLGQDGTLRQPLKPDTFARLSALLSAEKG
ncbi:hypothetical protein GCM10017056_24790 [Seohaeicola zhoushanensis]|uniref:Uncharacterized protein n=2 Tax=Seohaeicola zhoushanensis TaxID=1569283 RepID=A0A8J3GYP8_9RHOB|nr:hypothetical protein GCM10017056_24790 [Seohaeicola zhoushanensis]